MALNLGYIYIYSLIWYENLKTGGIDKINNFSTTEEE